MITNSQESNNSRKRKYLVTSKNVREVIKVTASLRKRTMIEFLGHLIDVGLRYEKEALRRERYARLFQPLHHFEYVVGRTDKTYLAVSNGVYDKVKVYAKKNGLKLVEAVWRLLTIGLLYEYGGNPRSNPLFAPYRDIYKTLMERAIEKHPEMADKFPLDTETLAIKMIDKKKASRGYGVTLSERSRLKRQMDLTEKRLSYARKRIQILEAENTKLKRKIAEQVPAETQEKVNLNPASDFPKFE